MYMSEGQRRASAGRAAAQFTAADALLRRNATSFFSCSCCDEPGGAAMLHGGGSTSVRLRRPRLVRRRLAIWSLTAAGYENVTLIVEVCNVSGSVHQNAVLQRAVNTGPCTGSAEQP